MNADASLGIAISVAMLFTACALPPTSLKRAGFERPPARVTVVVVPPDVELYELSAGGTRELKADWTDAAKAHVAVALREELTRRNAAFLPYTPRRENPAKEREYEQLLKLHDVVGGTIARHKYDPALALPTKDERLDWTLGPAVRALRGEVEADYALFVLFRDSYASAGRVAVIVGAAFLGATVPGGRQEGFASLVDLHSGDIVWFTRLIDSGGDLRTLDPAKASVQQLLKDLPL